MALRSELFKIKELNDALWEMVHYEKLEKNCGSFRSYGSFRTMSFSLRRWFSLRITSAILTLAQPAITSPIDVSEVSPPSHNLTVSDSYWTSTGQSPDIDLGKAADLVSYLSIASRRCWNWPFQRTYQVWYWENGWRSSTTCSYGAWT